MISHNGHLKVFAMEAERSDCMTTEDVCRSLVVEGVADWKVHMCIPTRSDVVDLVAMASCTLTVDNSEDALAQDEHNLPSVALAPVAHFASVTL